MKPCRKDNCDKPRYANLSICYSHYRAREKEKREEKEAKLKARTTERKEKDKKDKEEKAQRKLERKLNTKKYKTSKLKSLNNRCWKLMSELVRRTGADWRGFNSCFTCDKVMHWKDLQGGHRHHGKLDYDLRNIKPQCQTCNAQPNQGGKSGNLGEYERRLIKKHGMKWSDQLLLDSNTKPPYTITELEQIHTELKLKLANLKEI